ncbi:hypothetical protein [Streptomyces griseosporeus]|uniref:hypothetical protein n=1 Tax=Streptomyces griseosporeus TaxID=1910 RepID=UPI0036FE60E4
MADALEALYAAPAATTPPRTTTEHLQAASLTAFATDTPASNALGWWLRDTATIHHPDSSGRTCARDGDEYPCLDLRAALKYAELINAGTENTR